MKLGRAALMLVLALSALMLPGTLSGQAGDPLLGRDGPPVQLGQNYPNPFDLDTRIPFGVGDPPRCEDQGRLYRVSLRIYNILSQLIAIPLLQGGGGAVAGGQPLENVMLPCDRYVAHWDGKDQQTSQGVASGVYIYRLEVDGKPFVRRMWVKK